VTTNSEVGDFDVYRVRHCKVPRRPPLARDLYFLLAISVAN